MEDSGIDSDPKNLLGNGDDILFQVLKNLTLI